MLVPPWLQRRGNSGLQGFEIHQGPAALIELAADGRFGEVKMPVTQRVVALAVKCSVFLGRELPAVQTMRGAETGAETEKKAIATPVFGKEISPLMQTNPMDRRGLRPALVNVAGQGFSRDRQICQGRHFAI